VIQKDLLELETDKSFTEMLKEDVRILPVVRKLTSMKCKLDIRRLGQGEVVLHLKIAFASATDATNYKAQIAG
jgi:hypothetical protein